MAGGRMQRDWDLIREILATASRKAPGEKMLHTEIAGYLLLQVGDHVAALNDAGCLDAVIVRAHGYVVWATVNTITREGLELLDTLSCRQSWHRILEQAKGKEITFEFARQMGGLRSWHAGDTAYRPRGTP